MVKYQSMKNFFKRLKIKRRMITVLMRMHFFGNPSKKLKIIGVTGTNGKTTTVTLLYRIATSLGYKSGLISTVENIIGSEVFPHNDKSPGTTPDPVYLNSLLKKMVKEGCEYVFMEVSSHALDQNRVAGIKFTGGIFTNLTHDHLDYHKDLENYFKAKKKFFEMLPEKSFALSNADDDHGVVMIENIKARKFLYGFGGIKITPYVGHMGISHMSDIWEGFNGKIVKIGFEGLELDFNGDKIKSKLLGKFNAYNLLSVWSVSKLLNFNMEKVKDILENIQPPRGRFDHFISPDDVFIIIDYAHTPDALQKVLSTVREIKSGGSRIISVFGCGGDRDPLKRPKMGFIGASLSDIAIFTSDNPRSEDPEKIIDQMKDHLSKDESRKVITIADRRLAIEEAVKLAKKGDVILCAGKGHEEYQEIKGVKNHFNDKEEFQKMFNS